MTQPKHWQTKNITALTLWPLSVIYGAISAVNLAFRALNPYTPTVPVISIGNLNVGGVGKTPVVAYLAEKLAKNGHRVAILSRGYGGKQRQPLRLTAEDSAKRVGDEPAMLFNKFKHLPVDIWVGRNRKALAKRAQTAGATVLIVDDGFQYRGLARTLDFVVVDGKNGFGNGFLLPSGPLREPTHALKRADATLIMNSKTSAVSWQNPPSIFLQTSLSQADIAPLKGQKIIAFAGIGNPEKFFSALKKEDLNLIKTQAYRDHQPLTHAQWHALKTYADKHNAHLVTTEKDSARLTPSQRVQVSTVGLILTDTAQPNLWETVQAKILNPQ